jgi:aminomethyltransferase
MPIARRVHDRTFALAGSLNYREWSGYTPSAPTKTHHEHEYNAIRNASALIDVSPLFKYLFAAATRRSSWIASSRATRQAAIGQVSTRRGATSTARSSTMGP